MMQLPAFLTGLLFLQTSIFSPATASTRQPRDLRVAVVGAGAAGLSAALALRDLGYKNVTVFEAASQVGGKADSLEFEGRNYDLGAILVMPDFKTIKGLADRFKVPYGDPGMKYLVSQDDGSMVDIMKFPAQQYGAFRLMGSLSAFERYPHRDAAGIGGDFARAPREMNENFATFAKRHGFDLVGLGISPVTVGCGYGYASEVPALYWMQLANSLVPLFQESLREAQGGVPKTYAAIFPGGYRSLWGEISRHLDVRLNAPVSRVTRHLDSSGTVRVEVIAGGVTQEFDRIVIAAPGGHLDGGPAGDMDHDERAA